MCGEYALSADYYAKLFKFPFIKKKNYLSFINMELRNILTCINLIQRLQFLISDHMFVKIVRALYCIVFFFILLEFYRYPNVCLTMTTYFRITLHRSLTLPYIDHLVDLCAFV